MALFPPSRQDPYTLRRRGGVNVGEPFNLDSYTQVYSGLNPGQTTGIILTYDQSNGANFVDTLYTMTQPQCHMLDPFTGGVFDIKEPMVGCNGGLPDGIGFPLGNVWSQTVDKLRTALWRQRVIICCLGAGGTTSQQWAAGGDCNDRLKVGARRLFAHGLTPVVVLRHQGESDATSANGLGPGAVGDFTSTQIRDNIWSEVATLRAEGVTAPVIVCNVARYSNASVGSSGYLTTRQGQQLSWDVTKGIYAGPDTDVVDGTGRQVDEVHWNATGRNIVSTMFKDAIVAQVP